MFKRHLIPLLGVIALTATGQQIFAQNSEEPPAGTGSTGNASIVGTITEQYEPRELDPFDFDQWIAGRVAAGDKAKAEAHAQFAAYLAIAQLLQSMGFPVATPVIEREEHILIRPAVPHKRSLLWHGPWHAEYGIWVRFEGPGGSSSGGSLSGGSSSGGSSSGGSSSGGSSSGGSSSGGSSSGGSSSGNGQ